MRKPARNSWFVPRNSGDAPQPGGRSSSFVPPNDRPVSPYPTRHTLPRIPTDPPATILDHLARRMPKVPLETWARRFNDGLIYSARGPLAPDSPYEPGLELFVHREGWRPEPPVRVDWLPVHEDEELLVVDKPHALPVMPSGRYVTRALVTLLRDATGNADLVPLHRLDLETTGLVCFSKRPESRAALAALFLPGRIRKSYRAICELRESPPARVFTVSGRIEVEIPHWKRKLAREGEPDSESEVLVIAKRDGRAWVRVRPRTGKTHQIRVHLAANGLPIVHDRVYAEGLPPETDFEHPLQLQCARLDLVHPVTGRALTLRAERRLSEAVRFGRDPAPRNK